jgi:hypothetical protein
MVVWARAFRKAHVSKAAPTVERQDNEEVGDEDPYPDNVDEAEEWEQQNAAADNEISV